MFALYKTFNKIDKNNSIVLSFQSHILPIIICRIFSRKIVIRNSEDVLEATKYADNKISAYFVLILKFFFYNLSSGIITNSNKSKKSLQRVLFNKNKIKLIFNPCLKKVLKNKNNTKDRFILSVGRLCKQKNQEILIKAFPLFLKIFPDYKLILAGHGHDKLRLKRLGRKRQPVYRLVVMANTTKRDGRDIDQVGFYNPLTKETVIEKEKIVKWLKEGVQPTRTVKNLLIKNNLIKV